MVNENKSDIISNIPDMDPNRDKEEHDYVDYEQQRALFDSFINNLKCDVEKCNKVNREAQQSNALLTKELEIYKEKEKHFAKDKTIESKYCKTIKLLNNKISNLKSQACQNDKTFARENGKALADFENNNDVENPSLLNKVKELEPSLYNIDEIGKDFFSDHKIIFVEELKCEAEKRLKVNQRKSSLLYHGFVYGETQFDEPPKVPLKRRYVNLKNHLEQAQLSNYDPKLWKSLPMKYFCYVKQAMLKFEKEYVSKQKPPREDVFINLSFEENVKRIARNRVFEEFDPLVKDINLQLNCFGNGLVKEMKDDIKSLVALTSGSPFYSINIVPVIRLDQNRYPVDTSLIHIESRKSPTAVLFDVDTGRISIRHYQTKEYHYECSGNITRIMHKTLRYHLLEI
ncbi:hypothetical protein Tco_0943075 [Tanacetum coccineum]